MVKLHDGSHKKLSGDKLSARSEFQSNQADISRRAHGIATGDAPLDLCGSRYGDLVDPRPMTM
jgi:hypothetical protein